jgi:phosphatidylglycerophosphate synthase
MNLPNKLTMLRVLLIPVFMVCAANRWRPALFSPLRALPITLTATWRAKTIW